MGVRDGFTAKSGRGFTLLELLVVMVIIGLLAAYVGPKYFAQLGKSETKVAMAQIDTLGKALDQFRLDTGAYPATGDGLDVLVSAPAGPNKWDGPYLKKAVPGKTTQVPEGTRDFVNHENHEHLQGFTPNIKDVK